MYLRIRSGVIDYSRVSMSSNEDAANAERENFDQVLKGRPIHDIDDFNNMISLVEHGSSTSISGISKWLNIMFGKPSSMS